MISQSAAIAETMRLMWVWRVSMMTKSDNNKVQLAEFDLDATLQLGVSDRFIAIERTISRYVGYLSLGAAVFGIIYMVRVFI